MDKIARVLVVDDSPFVCRLLTTHIQSAPDLQVIGSALDGEQAIRLIKSLRPNVVTLDMELPKISGLSVLEDIMYQCPTPVVVVSGVSRKGADVTLQALRLGAVDFILKYTPGVDTNPDVLRQEIIAKVRMASHTQALVLDNRAILSTDGLLALGADEQDVVNSTLPQGVVVIGASTGGPVAVRELLTQLPADFAAAIIIVQHIPGDFTKVLAANLAQHTSLRVKETGEGDRLQAGMALLAPPEHHLLVRSDGRVELNQEPEVKGLRPCIDLTMESAAEIYGSRTIGVLLSGMGKDGSLGLAAIKAKGGKTFAQDAGSCVINGMPQDAVEKGVVDNIATPQQIGQFLVEEQSKYWSKEIV